MFGLLTQRKRVMACGCSHGTFINRAVADELLAFKRDFKPDFTLHLGDFLDTTAFLRSAGAQERGESIVEDCREGIDFLKELEPTHVFIGNHDFRLYKELKSNSAKDNTAALYVLDRLKAACSIIGCELVPYTGTLSTLGWRKIGNVVFGHGVMYNESAGRDHAEMFGTTTVFAHTHKMIRQPGRTMARTEGLSVGCLCDKPAMTYAAGRRSTAAWDNGWMYGEISGRDECLQLYKARTATRETVPEISLSMQSETQ